MGGIPDSKGTMFALASKPARLFTTLARAEMVTWTLLILAMIGKYGLDLGGAGVRVAGSLHGFVFLSYALVTVLVGVDQKWRLRDIAAGLAAAVIPNMTVPFKRAARRRGLLGEQWRLRHDEGAGAADALVRTVVRRPIPAALVGVVVIAVVLSALQGAGPPTQWFA